MAVIIFHKLLNEWKTQTLMNAKTVHTQQKVCNGGMDIFQM